MNQEQVKLLGLIKYGVAGFLGLLIFLGCFKVVPPGHRGVSVTMGAVSEDARPEGISFKLPFFTSIHALSVRIQKSEKASEAASKDLQKVSAKLALNWNINPTMVVKLYKDVGTEDDIENNIIAPAVSETLKAATAKMTAEEILTKRIELKKNIDETLIERLGRYGIEVKDVSLVDLDFTAQFNHAVETKQIAEQQAQQAKYEAAKATEQATAAVNKAKGEAESMKLRAHAEAESNALKLKTLTSELIRYEAVQKWDGKLPMVQGSGGGTILDLRGLNTKE